MSSTLKYTSLEEIAFAHELVHKTFKAGTTRPLEWRKQQLRQLARMLRENEDAIVAALQADMKKPALETISFEINPMAERSFASAEMLDQWAQPERVEDVPDWQKSWAPTIHKAPKGPALIIAPWNFPVHLLFEPLIGALAAGCTAVIKPSEVAPHNAALMAELVPKYLDHSAVRVVNGSVPETTRLLELKWAHIFYTGNSKVARIVSAAAAKHLTPMTLELGGKSPVVIDGAHTDIALAAKRILWGKMNNAGQVCVAPDYILVDRAHQDAFVASLEEAYRDFYPDGALGKVSYADIVSQSHYDRLLKLLKETHAKKAFGGKVDGHRGIEPTVFTNVAADDALLEGEIFGPLLPVVPYDTLQDAVDFINERPNPLSLYVFTDDQDVKQTFVDNTLSGGLIFNDTFTQLYVGNLPFSGVGESGNGSQHMKYTFDTFVHNRASIDIPPEAEAILGARYPALAAASA
ncbi:aldehyde dehydrogenase [Auriscalpium vulgare]|uniref:Aldehyde dehydrogenase n=1 Tax=Auriscalpium vulgare TaxID=40419 RepID=A0ACB8SA04_9AGAM|nr:aldehyde dehydrogenase [Auriscalpium vulgare]